MLCILKLPEYDIEMTQNRTSPELQPDTDYAVLVTKRGATYEIRIWELRLVVRGRDLQEAYREVLERKQQIIDWAREIGSLDELPVPRRSSSARLRPASPPSAAA